MKYTFLIFSALLAASLTSCKVSKSYAQATATTVKSTASGTAKTTKNAVKGTATTAEKAAKTATDAATTGTEGVVRTIKDAVSGDLKGSVEAIKDTVLDTTKEAGVGTLETATEAAATGAGVVDDTAGTIRKATEVTPAPEEPIESLPEN